MHWPFRVDRKSFLAIRAFLYLWVLPRLYGPLGAGSELSGFIFQSEDRGSCRYANEFPKETWRSG
jgi:hypothetical protein